MTGPAWETDAERSSAIALKGRIWTNAAIITNAYNGTTNYGPIPVNKGTLIGSVYCTADGETSAQFYPEAVSGGPAGIVGVSNSYNRCNGIYYGSDSTNHWWYYTETWRYANNSSVNTFRLLDCIGNNYVEAEYHCVISPTAIQGRGRLAVGVDWSSGTPMNGLAVSMYNGITGANAPTLIAKNKSIGLLGLHTYAALEWASTVGAPFYSGAVSGVTPPMGGLAVHFSY